MPMNESTHKPDASSGVNGTVNESAVLRTMERYPLSAQQQHEVTTRAMPRKPATTASPSASPPPVPTAGFVRPAVTAPFTSQAKLEQRVNAELASRLYDLLNQQLQARQRDLAMEAQQQAAMERAAAVASLGRPMCSPSPPPEPQQSPQSTEPTRSSRCARRAMGLVSGGVDRAAAATNRLGETDTNVTELTTHRLRVEEAPVSESCYVEAPSPQSDTTDSSFVTSVRDRVRQFRLDGTAGLNGVNLVRVKRLQAIPNHNRGLFAGLDGSPRTTRSGHFLVGRSSASGARVRSGAWYRLLHRQSGSHDASSLTASAEVDGALGVQGAKADGDSAGRHLSRGTGSRLWDAADSAMGLKTYGSGDHSFLQLLPGQGKDSRHPAQPPDHPGGSRASGGSARPSLAEDLQRILDERYGHALTQSERDAARDKVRAHRKKGPKESRGAASGSSGYGESSTGSRGAAGEKAEDLGGPYPDSGEGLGAHDAAGQWTLPELAGGDGNTGSAPHADGGGGRRHSFDYTMNSTEARLYGTLAPGSSAQAESKGAHTGRVGSGATESDDGGDRGRDRHGQHTPGSLSASQGALMTAHSAGEAHSPRSRPSTRSGGQHPNDLSTTNVLVTAQRQSSGKAASSPTTTAGSLAAAGDASSKAGIMHPSAGPSPQPAAKLELLTDSDNDENLDLFLAHFPETEEHVMLRKEANNILADFSEFDPFARTSSSDDEGLTDAEKEARRQRRQRRPHKSRRDGRRSGSDEGDDNADEPLVGFELDNARLWAKFSAEADEEYADLVAQRDRLLAEVQDQHVLMTDFTKDIFHLSEGLGGGSALTGDKFAIQLTKEVNAYAKAHHLNLKDIDLSRGAHSIEEVAEGFLDHFGKEKSTRRNVGTQVTDKDLGYADEGVRSAETILEDLVFHERGLMESIRLATVAIANIMSFHASLELESTCKECFYLFESPRTLWPCGHTFCQQCLSGMYNRNDELICAECGSICEVGYTPNLSVELVANYQTVQDVADSPFAGSLGNNSVHSNRGHGTIEVVLRRLLNDLLTVQRNYVPSDVMLPGTRAA